jgi:hypothetical protein
MTPSRTAASDHPLPSDAPPDHTKDYQGRPLVYVVRFCGTEESSVASAIRQAISVLDNFLQGQGAEEAQELVVVYRSRLPGAVTLQVGFPVSQRIAHAAGGEVFAGLTPSGPMVEMLPGSDLDDVLGVAARLPKGRASFTCWQIFRASDFRPWRQHPSVPVMAPAEFAGPAVPPEPS